MEFVDLKKYHESIQESLDVVINDVISESAFIGSNKNKYIVDFEQKFAAYIGTQNCVACANGTDAIEIVIEALGIKEGDEVIVPAISWYSTAEAVASKGAIPVFVDVDETCNISLDKIESAITPKTKAIIPVHLYGNSVNMNRLMLIAKEHNLLVIEDCAQSHGAKSEGQTTGTFGDAATFSFYPGKNLGAFGDAGAMIFKNESVAKIARQIRNHGQEEKHTHIRLGRNSRMDGIHAAVLALKIKDLDEQNLKRVQVAKLYDKYLDSSVRRPMVGDDQEAVFHLYVIQVEKRNELINQFKENGIPFGIHYPKPLPYLSPFNSTLAFEKASYLCERIISLPIHPFLTEEEVIRVSEIVNKHHSC